MRQSESAESLDTDFGKSPRRRRGPRTALSDAQLFNRRDQLLETFEASWGEIGWGLQTCRSPEELIEIFAPLLNSNVRESASVFWRPSTASPDSVTLRKLRAQRRSLVAPSYSAEESKRRVHDELQQVDLALGEKSNQHRRIVKQEQKTLRKEASRAEKQSRMRSGLERNVEMEIQAREASFARLELFRFLKSKRYELTPLSLANAATNLPYSGWRQSMRRSKKQPSKVGNGLMYQIFKAIRYLALRANRRTQKAFIQDFQIGIPMLPSRHKLAKVKLEETWLYVQRAIQQAYRANPTRSAMPFKITGQYLKQLHSRTPADLVLLKRTKIKLRNGDATQRPLTIRKAPIGTVIDRRPRKDGKIG